MLKILEDDKAALSHEIAQRLISKTSVKDQSIFVWHGQSWGANFLFPIVL
jgi:hypothetical protein